MTPEEYFNNEAVLAQVKTTFVQDFKLDVHTYDLLLADVIEYAAIQADIYGGWKLYARALVVTAIESYMLCMHIRKTLRKLLNVSENVSDTITIIKATATLPSVLVSKYDDSDLHLQVTPPWVLAMEYYTEERYVNGIVLSRADASENLRSCVSQAKIFAHDLAENPKLSTQNTINALLTSGQFWFHIVHDKVIASLPKDMFEEPSIESNLDISHEGLLDHEDFFFNVDGDPRENMPEAWMLESGCY